MHDRSSAERKSGLSPGAEGERRVAPAGTRTLAGARVLIVEDEMVVALAIESALHEAGCTVVGPVNSVAAALELSRSGSVDAVALDLYLNGEYTFAVAAELHNRSIPFVFATGYGDAALPERWQQAPRLSKPFRMEELTSRLAELLRE